jgi:hypothetical protein
MWPSCGLLHQQAAHKPPSPAVVPHKYSQPINHYVIYLLSNNFCGSLDLSDHWRNQNSNVTVILAISAAARSYNESETQTQPQTQNIETLYFSHML